MTYVPNDFITGNIVHFVQCYRKLDDTKGRGKMAARFGNTFRQILSNFGCESSELFVIKALNIIGTVNAVEHRIVALHRTIYLLERGR